MRHLRVFTWSAIALLAVLLSPAARANDDFAVAGGWQVTCTPNSATVTLGADAYADGFLFENGTFSAQAFAGLGFTPATYSVDSTGKFTATLVSDDRGSVVWKGRVSTGTIHGSVTWTKPDGSVFKYYYTGAATPSDTGSDTGQ
jgi:hypothetical protein